MTIGVAELKARLSAYLAQVKGGQELVITDHGRPVARLVPVRADDAALDDRTQRLVRAGTLVPARRAVPRELLGVPPGPAGAGVLDALLEERADGR